MNLSMNVPMGGSSLFFNRLINLWGRRFCRVCVKSVDEFFSLTNHTSTSTTSAVNLVLGGFVINL